MKSSATQRRRNPRGHGALLRDSIVAAASELLEETSNEDAVSLRAVARRIGITAPAIYAHFSDREQILEVVVSDAFADLFAAVSAAADAHTDPVARLRATCAAYLDFADERPGRFRLLFGRRRNLTEGIPRAESVQDMVGGEAFGTLISGVEGCVAAGRFSSDDSVRDATWLWLGLHGYATLRTSVPYFPWPSVDVMLDDLLERGGLSNEPGHA